MEGIGSGRSALSGCPAEPPAFTTAAYPVVMVSDRVFSVSADLPQGWSLRWVSEVDSTNRELQRMARRGCAAGTVLGTDRQTAGRGRLGRTWTSLGLGSLTFSVLLQPHQPQLRWHEATLVAGIAVSDALRQTGANLTLKWPNDVIAADTGEKCAGILSEKVITPTGAALVVGIGINVTDSPDLSNRPATSIVAAGGSTTRNETLARVLTELRHWFQVWESDVNIQDAYRKRCSTLGLQVRVETHSETLAGTTMGIDPQGGLILEVNDRCTVVRLADVTHLRPRS